MPNITEVTNQLDNTDKKVSVDAALPRCLIISSRGWLVTVDEQAKSLLEYNATDLTVHRNVSLNVTLPRSIAEYGGFYYIGSESDHILVIDISDLSVAYKINVAENSIRDIIFLNQGQRMIAASAYRDALLFFERVKGSPGNYEFLDEQEVNCPHTHGLLYINDSFFYATS